MGRAIFQCGTAVHLALLTVAPLFLFAIGKPSAQAAVLLWLSAFAAMWVVMNPAPRAGEWPRDARHRIGWELARDPFLTFGLIAIVISIVRAANGGIAMVYSASDRLWCLKGPAVALLPGSVSGAGILPLAGVVGLVIVTLGVRHALNASMRSVYLLATAILSAAAVVCWHSLGPKGGALPQLAFSADNPFSPGTLLGVFFLLAIVSWGESWKTDRAVGEILSALSASALLFGLIRHAPTHVLWCVLPLGVLLAVVGVLLSVRSRPSASWFRTAVVLLIALAPIAFLFTGTLARPVPWPVFSDEFLAVRRVASSVAIDAWKESAQLGVGLGAYPLARGFFAKPDDWQILSVAQTAAPNGWIHFLFERGFLGAAMLLAGLAILLRDGILRFIRCASSRGRVLTNLIGPLALAAVVAILFFDCSYVQLEALMPVGAALALTAASFSGSAEDHHG